MRTGDLRVMTLDQELEANRHTTSGTTCWCRPRLVNACESCWHAAVRSSSPPPYNLAWEVSGAHEAHCFLSVPTIPGCAHCVDGLVDLVEAPLEHRGMKTLIVLHVLTPKRL